MKTLIEQQAPYEIPAFPSTRFMGSKRRLLDFISQVASQLDYETVLDAFSGSGCVSFLFKSLGKEVTSNDFLAYSYHIANATVANNNTTASADQVDFLLSKNKAAGDFIQQTFNGLFFTPADNAFLDNISANIPLLSSSYEKSLAIAALCRAALKKQPRGVFTVIGHRYDDGRRDFRLSMRDQFINSISEYNAAVFDNNRKNQAFKGDIFQREPVDYDLVYIDPPYYSPHSDNDYIRRYHFIEGLATYWTGVKIKEGSRTQRLEKRDTPFCSRARCYEAFDQLFAKFPNSKLLVSYSSNSLPTREEMIDIMKKHRRHVEVFEYDHKYSFGNHNHKVGNNRNSVQEYLFLGHS